MPELSDDLTCPSCGAGQLCVQETRHREAGKSRESFRGSSDVATLKISRYTRRRRYCKACGHRFQTIEISREALEQAAAEIRALRVKLAQVDQAMATLGLKRPDGFAA